MDYEIRISNWFKTYSSFSYFLTNKGSFFQFQLTKERIGLYAKKVQRFCFYFNTFWYLNSKKFPGALLLPKKRFNVTPCIFFIVTTAISLFILCHFFLGGEKKRERENNGDKKCTEFRFIRKNIFFFYRKKIVRKK